MQKIDFKKLEKNTVHLWVIDKTIITPKVEYLYNLLSGEEKLKANKFRFEKDRTTSIIARGVLRILLSKYLNISPEKVNFKYGEFGKPELKEKCNQNLKFNVSHSKDLIVLCFTKDSEIGVDVEFVKTDFEVLDIVDNYFSKSEIKALYKLPNTEYRDAFYRGWTRKEAFIKAKAKGLSFPLDSFSITMFSDDNAKIYETLWDTNEKKSWSIIPFKTLPNYKSAIAIKGQNYKLKYLEFVLDTFMV